MEIDFTHIEKQRQRKLFKGTFPMLGRASEGKKSVQ